MNSPIAFIAINCVISVQFFRHIAHTNNEKKKKKKIFFLSNEVPLQKLLQLLYICMKNAKNALKMSKMYDTCVLRW
jgi:hypothetical protein